MRNFSKNLLVLSPSDDISLRSFSLVGVTRPLHDLRWQVDGIMERFSEMRASSQVEQQTAATRTTHRILLRRKVHVRFLLANRGRCVTFLLPLCSKSSRKYSCQNKIWKRVTRDVTTVCVSIFLSGTSTASRVSLIDPSRLNE